MHSRVLKRVLTIVLTVIVGVGFMSPSLTARATTEPPFEVVFPQETSETYFSSTFGAYRSGGRRHKGNDLMAPRMTEVYAIADGVVIYVGLNRLSGRNIKIDHGDGWQSFYLHLNNDNPGTDDGRGGSSTAFSRNISVGGFVDAGQVVGFVGDSGNAEHTLPHTHFELHRNGRAIDPFGMLVLAHQRGRMAVQAERLSTLADRIT